MVESCSIMLNQGTKKDIDKFEKVRIVRYNHALHFQRSIATSKKMSSIETMSPSMVGLCFFTFDDLSYLAS